MAIRVFIGVGHGGSDKGASCYVVEKDANLTIALAARDVLEAAGCIVGMSRVTDEDDPVSEEISEANAFGADVAFEVHNNAARGDGWECFVQTNKYASQSRKLAELIEEEVKAIGQNSRGIKTYGYWWTNGVKAPAVLLEGFFVDNWNDAKDFDTVEEQQALGRAYARGVLKYLGVSEKPAEEKQPEPAKEVYTVEARGEFSNKAKAEAALANVEKLGFTGTVTAEVEQVAEIKVNSTVRMKAGAKYYDGKTPKDFVYQRDHKVHSMNGDRVVITFNGSIVGPVHKKDLTLIK